MVDDARPHFDRLCQRCKDAIMASAGKAAAAINQHDVCYFKIAGLLCVNCDRVIPLAPPLVDNRAS